MKNYKYLLLLTAVIAFSSCTKDDANVSQTTDQASIAFAGTASPTSRTAYEADSEGLKVQWTSQDQIGIFAEIDGSLTHSNAAYQAQNSGTTTGFDPVWKSETIEWGDETSTHNFYAYYPYNDAEDVALDAIPVSVPAQQTQTGTALSHIADYDFLYASLLNQSRTEETVEFSFSHLFSVLEVELNSNKWANLDAIIFRCTDPSEAVSLDNAQFDLQSGNLDISQATTTNQIRIDCKSVVLSNTSPTYVRMVITPGHAGKTFETVAVVGGEEQVVATKTVPSTGIPTGKTVSITGNVTIEEGQELTVIDLSEEGTANSYIVNIPDQMYKFKATVKGNGIPRTYSWTTEVAYNEGYTAADLELDPKSVLVLWYNCGQTSSTWVDASPVVIESVTLESDGYIHFKTPEEFVYGHALIAAFDTEGLTYETVEANEKGVITNANILWTWDIWGSMGYDPNDPTNQIQIDGYTIMDRNMGALTVGDGTETDPFKAAWAAGNIYQWGRKDPFPGPSDYSSTSQGYSLFGLPTYTPILALQNEISATAPKQIFKTSGDYMRISVAETAKGDATANFTAEEALSVATRNPHKWLNAEATNTSPYLWAITSTDWNGTTTQATRNAWRYFWGDPAPGANEDKSIFDPCPVGWKIMRNDALKAFASAMTNKEIAPNRFGVVASDAAQSFETFLPLSGERATGNGGIGSISFDWYYGGVMNLYASGFSGTGKTGYTSRSNFSTNSSKDLTIMATVIAYPNAGYALRCMKDTE